MRNQYELKFLKVIINRRRNVIIFTNFCQNSIILIHSKNIILVTEKNGTATSWSVCVCPMSARLTSTQEQTMQTQLTVKFRETK